MIQKVISFRQKWFPKNPSYVTGYWRRNLGLILKCDVEEVTNDNTFADIEIVSVFSFLPSIIRRRYHKLLELKKKISGYEFIHGGMNKDVDTRFNMGDPPKNTNFDYRIWYTGENIRPPFENDYDLTISFDTDGLGGRNLYLPISYMLLHERSEWIDPELGIPIDSSSLVMKRIYSENLFERKFACAFINNPQSFRLHAVEELRKYGEVDIYGGYSGNLVDTKFEVGPKYKYMICFENDLYPGYVTEKLIHAYKCDTVPLYWGTFPEDGVFNEKSFINLTDYESIHAFSKFVSSINENHYRVIYEENLISDIEPVRAQFNELKKRIESLVKRS